MPALTRTRTRARRGGRGGGGARFGSVAAPAPAAPAPSAPSAASTATVVVRTAHDDDASTSASEMIVECAVLSPPSSTPRGERLHDLRADLIRAKTQRLARVHPHVPFLRSTTTLSTAATLAHDDLLDGAGVAQDHHVSAPTAAARRRVFMVMYRPAASPRAPLKDGFLVYDVHTVQTLRLYTESLKPLDERQEPCGRRIGWITLSGSSGSNESSGSTESSESNATASATKSGNRDDDGCHDDDDDDAATRDTITLARFATLLDEEISCAEFDTNRRLLDGTLSAKPRDGDVIGGEGAGRRRTMTQSPAAAAREEALFFASPSSTFTTGSLLLHSIGYRLLYMDREPSSSSSSSSSSANAVAPPAAPHATSTSTRTAAERPEITAATCAMAAHTRLFAECRYRDPNDRRGLGYPSHRSSH